MLYLLDTDTTSYLIKKNNPHHEKVLQKLLSLYPEDVAISSITVSELTSGFHQISDQNPIHKKRIKEALEYFITAINVIDFTLAAAFIYGEIRGQLKLKGNDMGAMDSLIAAHALSEKRILVTNNTKHFSRINHLKIENWIA